MSNKIVGAVIARNEAGRYLKRVIENLHEKCDEVLLVDDHSTDETAKLAKAAGAIVMALPTQSPMWGKETPARSFLWEQAARRAGDGWIYFADADHITMGSLRELAKSWVVNAWALPLYDIWTSDEQFFRADGFWQGYLRPRIWMVAPSRTPEGWTPVWPGRGIHSGHIPPNFPFLGAIAPAGTYIAHLGYATETDRQSRYENYLRVKDQLSEPERAHAESILE